MEPGEQRGSELVAAAGVFALLAWAGSAVVAGYLAWRGAEDWHRDAGEGVGLVLLAVLIVLAWLGATLLNDHLMRRRSNPPAGWYPGPSGERWWDGQQWTEHVR